MDWRGHKIHFEQTLWMPSDDKLRELFLMGIKVLFVYNNRLLSSDDNYSTFLRLYEKVCLSTITDFFRSYLIFQATWASKNVKGCTGECGVFRGGTSLLIANVNAEKKHYALDTFEGFPDIASDFDHKTTKKGGYSDVSITEVQKLFAEYENIIMLKGEFLESFEKIREELFSFIHIDADLYESTVQCLDFFYPRLSKGGIMVLDDYLSHYFPGVKKAVDEFFANKNEFPIVLPTSQAMVFKL